MSLSFLKHVKLRSQAENRILGGVLPRLGGSTAAKPTPHLELSRGRKPGGNCRRDRLAGKKVYERSKRFESKDLVPTDCPRDVGWICKGCTGGDEAGAVAAWIRDGGKGRAGGVPSPRPEESAVPDRVTQSEAAFALRTQRRWDSRMSGQ